jgi:uncharacterized protein (TIGR02677 family)
VSVRRDRQRLLAHAVEEGAPLYRAIMHVFVTAADSYHLRLRVDDVASRLEPVGQYPHPVTAEELNYRLGKLCEWGNLHRDRDEALTTTLAEFETRGFVYDLTPGGEKAHLAIEDLDRGLQAVGGLQSTVLRRIVDLLRLTADNTSRGAAADGEQLYNTLNELHTIFRTLTANATLFMQQVSRVLYAATLDPETFNNFKAETVAYLTTFIDDVEVLAHDVSTQLRRLSEVDEPSQSAALRLAAAASGEFSIENPERDLAGEYIHQAEERLAGLAEWFTGNRDNASRAELLREAARSAVLGILRAVERLRDSLNQPVGQGDSLLKMAQLFAAAPDDERAHELWRAAFGLTSSRHLSWAHPDADQIAARTSWWDSPPVEVPASLRATGHSDTIRRATRVPDRSAAKRRNREKARAEQARAAEAVAALLELGERPLAELPPLPQPAFALLHQLLEIALRVRPDSSGRHTAVSLDGRYRITLTPLSGEAAVHVADRGALTLSNYTLNVSRTRPARHQQTQPPTGATSDETVAASRG